MLFLFTDIEGSTQLWQAYPQENKALPLLQAALATYRQYADFYWQITALLGMHTIYWVQSQHTADREVLDELLTLTQTHGSAQQRAQTLNGLSGLARGLGNYAEAEAYTRQALEIQQANHDQINIADSLDRLGMLQYERGNCAEARALIEQAISNIEPLNLPLQLAFYYNHLAKVWRAEDPQKALLFLQKSIELGREIGNLRVIAYGTIRISEILIQQKRTKEALLGLEQSFALFEQVKDYSGMCNVAINQTIVYLDSSQLSLAHVSLIRAAQLALPIKDKMMSYHLAFLYARYLHQAANPLPAYGITTFLLNQNDEFLERSNIEALHNELAAGLDESARAAAPTQAQSLTITTILQEIASLPPQATHGK